MSSLRMKKVSQQDGKPLTIRHSDEPSIAPHRRLPRVTRANFQVDSPAPPCPGCFGVAPRLLLRSRPTTVASESPHDCCLGVAPRLLTSAGQKLMLLAKLAYSRRQFSPSGQRIRAVHTHLPPSAVFLRKAREHSNRTSKIVHRT